MNEKPSYEKIIQVLKALHDLNPCEDKYRHLCDIDRLIEESGVKL